MARKKSLGLGSFAVIAVLILLVGVAVYLATNPVHYGDVQVSGATGQTGSSGKLGVGMTIEYADGTVKNVDPSQIQYTLFPLSVYLQGQPISKVTWHCYVQLDWTGDLVSVEFKGPMEVKSNTGATLRRENMYKTFSMPSLPAKNQWFDLWKFSLTAEEIEYSLGASGDYTLTCTVSVNATATFFNGLQSTKSASASGNLPISVQTGGLLALVCDVQAQTFQ